MVFTGQRLFHRSVRGLILIGVGVGLSAARAAAMEPVDSTGGWQQQWSEVVALASRGEFASARQRLEGLEGRFPAASKADRWLGEYLESSDERRRANQIDFKKYVEYAQHAHEVDNLDTALFFARLALANSADHEAFRRQEWLTTLVADAVEKAAQERSEAEWRDAAGIYDQLTYLFERNADYEKMLRECLTHFRLEFIYRPDSNWEEALEGINQEMARDTFWYLDRSYVTEADFRKMTIAGFEQQLLLVRTPGLREVFPSLQDELDREQFEKRIEKRIAEVSRRTTVRRDQARNYFETSLKINRQTVQLPEALIISEFMRGALGTLDEFTTIFWPIEFREFQKHTDGEFIGVGIQISMRFGEITVVTPLEGTPAHRAGIQAGDVIVKINGDSTTGLTLSKAVQQITGPTSTSVILTIRRRASDGEEREIDFPLTRSRIELHTVKGRSRDPIDELEWNHLVDEEMGIGYIRATNFSKRTTQELYATIERLRGEGLRALILDLRGNPGGLLESARGVADLFLPKGDLIVRVSGARTQTAELPAESSDEFETLPLTILINGQSASASEIVAGAMRDHKRAILVGERTFGKFSVQNLQPLSGREAALKYTTAWYYLPGGDNLHRREGAETWGVEPNVVVELVPKERQRLREMIRAAERVGPEAPVYQPEPNGEASDELEVSGEANDELDVSEEGIEGQEADSPTEDDSTLPTEGDDLPTEGDDGESTTEPQSAADVDDFDYADSNERPESDPQLDAALLVTRLRLLSVLEPMLVSNQKDRTIERAEVEEAVSDN